MKMNKEIIIDNLKELTNNNFLIAVYKNESLSYKDTILTLDKDKELRYSFFKKFEYDILSFINEMFQEYTYISIRGEYGKLIEDINDSSSDTCIEAYISKDEFFDTLYDIQATFFTNKTDTLLDIMINKAVEEVGLNYEEQIESVYLGVNNLASNIQCGSMGVYIELVIGKYITDNDTYDEKYDFNEPCSGVEYLWV